MQSLFIFLKMVNHPSKHENDSISWEIVENLYHVVLIATKEKMMALNFFSFFVNEAIIIDNQS